MEEGGRFRGWEREEGEEGAGRGRGGFRGRGREEGRGRE